MEELIVLVDDNNNQIGTLPKPQVHHANTPLHRGFSAFIFNSRGEVLLQQRSAAKKAFPLVWSNSCCGHPGVGESVENAATRRLDFELGLRNIKLEVILPNFRYRCEMNGVVENEICPVLVGFTDQIPTPNPDEVAATRHEPWDEFVKTISEHYSPWAVEEVELLVKDAKFAQFIKGLPKV